MRHASPEQSTVSPEEIREYFLVLRGVVAVALLCVLLSACSGVAVEQEQSPIYTAETIVLMTEDEEQQTTLIPCSILEASGEKELQGNRETQAFIEQLSAQYGMKITMPKNWPTLEGRENLPWTHEELTILAEVIPQLPASFLEDEVVTKVVLIKIPGADGGSGGRECNGEIIIYLPEKHHLEGEIENDTAQYHGTYRERMISTIIHEWAHAYDTVHPEILEEWREATGWYYDEEIEDWRNSRPENLIHKSHADTRFWEDFAVSAAVFYLNPDALSEDRRNFFEDHPAFAGWQAEIGETKY